MNETRTGERTSLQISAFGAVTGLASANFSLGEKKSFLIKNDGSENVTLEVLPAIGSAWVETVFQPGWNPEIVQMIRKNANELTLLWGY
jgi:hypothetical protein